MRALKKIAVLAALLVSCRCKSAVAPDAETSSLTVVNDTNDKTIVYVAFGSDSNVLPTDWSFCAQSSALNCSFVLDAKSTQPLPTSGSYLNATISFGAPVTCGQTKAELNLNNPNWYDIADVSLVDGYSNNVAITINGTKLGPPVGATGNEKVYGLFPLGCDLCTARSASTPCGMKPGTDGCKSGSQYDPDVPCQYQGPTKGGGSQVLVTLKN